MTNVCTLKEVTHWLSLPSLPGDKHSGDKLFELIEEISLQAIDQKESSEE